MLSKKDDDDDKYGGGKNKGVGKNSKNQKNNTTNNNSHNTNNNTSINNNNNTNNVTVNTDQIIHNYIECSAYCHINKRIGDTDEGTEGEGGREGGGGGGGGGGEGERTRAYWLCQLPVSSVSLVTDQKITVRENYGTRDSTPSDVAHTSLLPAMSDLTGLAYGKIYTEMKINRSSDMNFWYVWN